MVEIAGATAQAGLDFFSSALSYMFYFVLLLFGIGIALFIMYISKYNIKMTYFPIIGNVQKNKFSIDKPKTVRLRWNSKKNGWNILFTRKNIEPFDPEFIYAGNNCYAFKVGDQFIPAKMDIDSEERNFSFKPIPYSVNNWAMVELMINEQELTKKSWWDENKSTLTFILTLAICATIVILTIYYTYKFYLGGLSKVDSLIEVLKNTNVIQRAR